MRCNSLVFAWSCVGFTAPKEIAPMSVPTGIDPVAFRAFEHAGWQGIVEAYDAAFHPRADGSDPRLWRETRIILSRGLIGYRLSAGECRVSGVGQTDIPASTDSR